MLYVLEVLIIVGVIAINPIAIYRRYRQASRVWTLGLTQPLAANKLYEFTFNLSCPTESQAIACQAKVKDDRLSAARIENTPNGKMWRASWSASMPAAGETFNGILAKIYTAAAEVNVPDAVVVVRASLPGSGTGMLLHSPPPNFDARAAG